MIYVLFKLLYGDRRSAIARQVAAHRNALNEQPPKPFLVASREGARPAPWAFGVQTRHLGRRPLQRTAPERSTHLRQEDRTQDPRLARSAS